MFKSRYSKQCKYCNVNWYIFKIATTLDYNQNDTLFSLLCDNDDGDSPNSIEYDPRTVTIWEYTHDFINDILDFEDLLLMSNLDMLDNDWESNYRVGDLFAGLGWLNKWCNW